MHWFKKVFVIISVFGIILNIGLTAQGNQGNDSELLIKSFTETNAEVEAYWLSVGQPYLQFTGDNDLLENGKQLSEVLELPVSTILKDINNQLIYHTIGTWGKGTEIELQLKRVSNQDNRTYLIFRLKGQESVEDLSEFYSKLDSKLQQIQITPVINACIQGFINDKLNNDQQFVLIKGILESLQASEIEQLDTALVKSISAYTPKLNNSIITGGQKMNLQVASHVNNLDNKTILTLGTPIITIEY